MIPELVGGSAICNMGLLPVSPEQRPPDLLISHPGEEKRLGTLIHPSGRHVSMQAHTSQIP